MLTATNGFYNGPDDAKFAFDGQLTSTYADTSGPGETITFTPITPIVFTDKVEVYIFNQKNVNGSINGGTAVSLTGDPAIEGWYTVAEGGGTMTTLEVIGTTNFVSLAGVRIDGRLYVDNGVWDNSQNWSDGAAGFGYNLSNIFVEAQQHMVLQMLARL